MNRSFVLALAMASGIAVATPACGVRGRPQPPLTPAELGRGQPSFKRATEGMAVKSVPAVGSTPDPRRNKSADGSVE